MLDRRADSKCIMMKSILLTGCLLTVMAAQDLRGQDAGGFSGKVLQTTNASAYTYVLVDAGTNKMWAAAPAFDVKVGDTVSISSAMPMPKHHSKTMNRDFDVVYFTPSVVVNGAKPAAGDAPRELPKGHPQIGAAAGAPTPSPKPESFDFTGIKKAEGGMTVAEVYAAANKLVGKSVSVRGKVVKYNPQIMNRDWIHVRDGSGQEGRNDLLVTTSKSAPLKIGDVILATGKVATNRDFGANYKYSVMLEDATVK